jgi:hypothetical protein
VRASATAAVTATALGRAVRDPDNNHIGFPPTALRPEV